MAGPGGAEAANGASAEDECGAAKGGGRKQAEEENHVRPVLRLVPTP